MNKLEEIIINFDYDKEEHWFDAPIEGLLDEAKSSPAAFLRDKATRVTSAISPYIRRFDLVEKTIDKNLQNIFNDVTKRLVNDIVCPNPDYYRFMHIDLAKNHDALGISMCYVSSFKGVDVTDSLGNVTVVHKPVYTFDFISRILPPKGGDIEIADIEYVVYDLIKVGYPILLVTFDGYQSLHSIQNFRNNGIISANLSIDRTTSRVMVDFSKENNYRYESVRGDSMAAYSSLRNAIYEERLHLPYHDKWIEELKQQEEENGRVRKIVNGYDDLVQTVAGSVFNAESNSVFVPKKQQKKQDNIKQRRDEEFMERMSKYNNANYASNDEDFYENLEKGY